jgi:creatinine amidohydrolase
MDPSSFNPASLHLEELTWPEVGAALEAGWTRIVIPVGAVEQHGHHLPLAVDALRGREMGRRVAERRGSALVAPVIQVGCSDHHMGFPGTLTIRRQTLQAIVEDYVTSLAAHGFSDILLMPSHGGNFLPLREGLPEFRAALKRGAGCDGGETAIHAYSDLDGFLELWKGAVEAQGGDPSGVGGHAGLAESSEMLAIRPDLVRRAEARPGVPGPSSPELIQKVLTEGFRSVTDVGVLGDPAQMSAPFGEACLEAVSDAIAEYWQAQVQERVSSS